MTDAQALIWVWLFLVLALTAFVAWDRIGRNAYYDLLDWIEPATADDPTPAQPPPAPAQECADDARPIEVQALPPGDRGAVVRALVAAGWSVGQIRDLLKGDNARIGGEVEAARGSERRVIRVGGAKGRELEL